MFVVLAGCGGAEARWKTVPESSMEYDAAWNVIVNTVTQHFDLETVDAQSGYLKSGWKVEKTFLGMDKARRRCHVRVEQRAPLKIKVKVELEKWNSWTESWQGKGNDSKIEDEVLTELSGRLR
jgi:hypothetical protein